MDIDYLIQLLGNRQRALTSSFDQAFGVGDLERMNSLEIEIQSVNDTLYKLHLLGGISAAASASGMSAATVVSSGIDAIANASVLLPADQAVQCLREYDITPYATDPLHEQKIADILTTIGTMNSAADIDTYIDREAIGSPVSGISVILAAQTYAVDARLMLAIMEQDSRFGTAGLAIATRNPGNVGNNDSGATRTYATWADGVSAVAEWLSRHRIAATAAPVPEAAAPVYEESPAPVAEEPTPEPTPEVASEVAPEPEAPAQASETPATIQEPTPSVPETPAPTAPVEAPITEPVAPVEAPVTPTPEPVIESPVVIAPSEELVTVPDSVVPEIVIPAVTDSAPEAITAVTAGTAEVTMQALRKRRPSTKIPKAKRSR